MKKYYLEQPNLPAPKVDYARELNPEQLQVVTAADGPILVIAGAGSGKTRTVTYRMAWLIESGVDPQNILLVTFTNKAAREMLRRIEQLLACPTQALWAGTFHHIAHRILRRHAKLLGYSNNFTILDREDSRDLLASCFQEENIRRSRHFPSPEVIGSIASLAANTGWPLTKVLDERFPYLVEFAEPITRIIQRYQAKKQELNLMDFDDLLSLWLRLLKEEEGIARLYQDCFRYILVDEYQDTNHLQGEIVDILAAGHRNLMVVGDDSQSIYSFRGADFENIMRFPVRYPEARIYKLETNYRSTPEILELANRSIAHNLRQYPKRLRAAKPSGLLPVFVPLLDVMQQADFVAQHIRKLAAEGLPLSEIAVLYRSHYHSMELQMELTRQGIPFEVRSGLRFFEQRHIKDVASYLKLTDNPYDEVAWKRLLKLIPRIGPATAERIWQAVRQAPDPLGAAFQGRLESLVPGGAKPGWRAFLQTLWEISQPKLLKSPAEQIRIVINSGYEAYLQATFPDYSSRLDDLRQLADFALKFPDTRSFLAELSLLNELAAEGQPEVASSFGERVILSSIHQAKGLEWTVVFIIWLAEGRLPSAKALETPGAAEEERRLFYVACTRAKERLFLCYPSTCRDRSRRTTYLFPSRFITELEAQPQPLPYEEWVIEYSSRAYWENDEIRQ